MYRLSLVCVCVALGVVPARAADIPPSLALVPGDAAGFLTVDVPAVLESPLLEEVRFALGAIKPAELAAFTKKFPIDPTTVERIVVVMPTTATVTEPVPYGTSPTAVSALAVFGCSKPFDPALVNKGFYPTGRPKAYRGHTYHFDDESWSGLLVLPGNRTFVLGTEDSLVWLIDRMEKGEVAGALSPARAEAVGHTLFFAMNPAIAVPADVKLPPALQPLTTAQRVCVAVDLGNTIKASVELHFANVDGAAAGEKAVKAVIELGREQLKALETMLQQEIDKPARGGNAVTLDQFPEKFAALLGVGALRRADEVIAKLPVERKGTTVRVTGELSLRHGTVAMIFVGVAGISALGRNANETFHAIGPGVKIDGGPPEPTPQEVRLKKLAAAFDAYHAEHGHYPPAATLAKDGTPLLSWRVALLPHLGEKKLYEEFRQDEPWDSLHNKKLIAKMPEVFKNTSNYRFKFGRTSSRVVTGPGTLFDNPKGVKKPVGSSPILAVEASETWDSANSVWWTKPADLVSAPGKPPKLFDNYEFSSCWVLLTDGTVKRLTKKDDEKRLGELISPTKKRD